MKAKRDVGTREEEYDNFDELLMSTQQREDLHARHEHSEAYDLNLPISRQPIDIAQVAPHGLGLQVDAIPVGTDHTPEDEDPRSIEDMYGAAPSHTLLPSQIFDNSLNSSVPASEAQIGSKRAREVCSVILGMRCRSQPSGLNSAVTTRAYLAFVESHWHEPIQSNSLAVIRESSNTA